MNFNYTFIIRKYCNISIVLSNTYFEENIFKFVLYENIKFAFELSKKTKKKKEKLGGRKSEAKDNKSNIGNVNVNMYE